jgi:hypothetical protein
LIRLVRGVGVAVVAGAGWSAARPPCVTNPAISSMTTPGTLGAGAPLPWFVAATSSEV